jgi:acylphosphatase
MEHVNITVRGKVQGVFFRKSTQEKAYELQISGYVQNERDGSVYIEAEGEKEKIDEFIEWCKKGPKNAEVTEIKTRNGNFQNYEDFEIAYV